MAKGTDLSIVDEELIRLAANNKSGAEMQEILGIPAAQAIVRVRQLLREKDVWTQIERRQLLLESMYTLKDQLEVNVINLNEPKEVEAYLKVLSTIGERLDVASEITTEQMEKVTQAQALRLLQIYSLATERAKEILSAAHPEAVMADIDAALAEGIRVAAVEIEDADWEEGP